jgi:hypothetical protein
MVAVTLLAATLALTINAANVGYRVSTATAERLSAARELALLVGQPMFETGEILGETSGFVWTLSLQPVRRAGETYNFELCRKRAVVTSAASGRSYEAGTVEVCPPEYGL